MQSASQRSSRAAKGGGASTAAVSQKESGQGVAAEWEVCKRAERPGGNKSGMKPGGRDAGVEQVSRASVW